MLLLVGGIVLTNKRTGSKDIVHVHAYFRDASGLTERSRVQIAGIPVGQIEGITLEGGRAKLRIAVRRDAKVRKSASLMKRSESLLGDFLLDLNPGAEPSPLLVDGDEIANVMDSQGMEKLLGSLNVITSDIQQVTDALKNVLGGTEGKASLQTIVKNMVDISNTMNSSIAQMVPRLNSILESVDRVANDIQGLSSRESSRIESIIGNIDGVAADVRSVMASVRKIVGENEKDVGAQVSSVKDSLKKLDKSLENIENITGQVREGKGIAGALLNERLGQNLTDAIDGVSTIVNRISSIQLEASIRADYLFNQASAKTFFAARIIPNASKYYLLEVVDDPRGNSTTTFTQTNPPKAGDPSLQKQVVTTQGVKFSAQFAKRFGPATLRVGIIESTGGVGGDINVPIKFPYFPRWIDDALVLKVDLFNFSVEELRWPRLRATVRFTPIEHIYINGGIDDAINSPNRDTLTNRMTSGRDFFVGGGVYFTDTDLLSILAITPRPK